MNLWYLHWRPESMCLFLLLFHNNDFCPPPIFWIVDHQSTYYILAGFGILLLLINVMIIMLKVFWIEVILLWRDIARPYKTRNGKWQVLSCSSKEEVLQWLLVTCLLIFYNLCFENQIPFCLPAYDQEIFLSPLRGHSSSRLVTLMVLRFTSSAQTSSPIWLPFLPKPQ